MGGALVKDKRGYWRTTNYDEGDNFGVSGDRVIVVAASILVKSLAHKENFLVISLGGKGQLASIKDAPTVASVIKKELVKFGIRKDKIMTEEDSGDTFQQLEGVQEILKKEIFSSIVIISNKYHLPRIQAMIKYSDSLQALKKMLNLSKLKIKSAEAIVIKSDPKKWRKVIKDAYSSEPMKNRIRLEQKGVVDIKKGVYKYKINFKIELNKYGFYEVINKPSEIGLKEYYSNKYYQESMGSYQNQYSLEEVTQLNNKINEKYFVISQLLGKTRHASLLDIGCGEGWALDFFIKKGWEAIGLDYSEYGCKNIHPHCFKNLIAGNIYDSIIGLINKRKKFDVIWLDNVLEHVIDPLSLLKQMKSLATDNSILVIEVPNDYSVLQKYLFKKGLIDKEFWFDPPEHVSYFNKNGLVNIAKDAGWNCKFVMADNPIDFNLLNSNTNYIKDRTKGKSCHLARVEIDNLMHSISLEKTVKYFQSLAELGLGRQVIAFFSLNKLN